MHNAGRTTNTKYICIVKKWITILSLFFLSLFSQVVSFAQCSMCTKTAQQLGEKPAAGLNSAIIYLMLMPFAIIGFIGYRWWKNRTAYSDEENNA